MTDQQENEIREGDARKMDNSGYSSLFEPKEEPLDDFLLIPAENETDTQSAAIMKKEVKEESIDLVDSFSFANEVENDCKKEEILDNVMVEMLSQDGTAIKSEENDISSLFPVEPKMEVLEDRVVIAIENPNSLEFFDDSNDEARHAGNNVRPCSGKFNDEELASSSGLPVTALDIVEMSSNELKQLLKRDSLSELQLEVIRKIRRRGRQRSASKALYQRRKNERVMLVLDEKIGEEDSSRGLSIEKEEVEKGEAIEESITIPKKRKSSNIEVSTWESVMKKQCKLVKINATELKCPECEYRTRTAGSWESHLRESHSTTATLAGLALLCDCGHVSASVGHSRKCDSGNLTLIRKTTPQCVMCEMFPKSIYGYIIHLRDHHKSTLIKKNIYLKCSCGLDVFHDRDCRSIEHSSKCASHLFTLHTRTNHVIPQYCTIAQDSAPSLSFPPSI